MESVCVELNLREICVAKFREWSSQYPANEKLQPMGSSLRSLNWTAQVNTQLMNCRNQRESLYQRDTIKIRHSLGWKSFHNEAFIQCKVCNAKGRHKKLTKFSLKTHKPVGPVHFAKLHVFITSVELQLQVNCCGLELDPASY